MDFRRLIGICDMFDSLMQRVTDLKELNEEKSLRLNTNKDINYLNINATRTIKKQYNRKLLISHQRR